MRQRNLTKEERIKKLKDRREFLITELYAAHRLDGWHLKGLSQELKKIREKLVDLDITS
tara:strand:+ start:1282 stop:1458 length:177 start_codon:yes stop_codon:yes gene_type:complete